MRPVTGPRASPETEPVVAVVASRSRLLVATRSRHKLAELRDLLALPDVELQGTAEGRAFSREELDGLLDLAHVGLGRLFEAQAAALATVKR